MRREEKQNGRKKFSYFSFSCAVCSLYCFGISWCFLNIVHTERRACRGRAAASCEKQWAFRKQRSVRFSFFIRFCACRWMLLTISRVELEKCKSNQIAQNSKNEQKTNEKEKVFPTEKSKVGEDEQISSVFLGETSPMHVKLMGKSLMKMMPILAVAFLCFELAKKFVSLCMENSRQERVRWATHKKVIKNFPPRAQQQQLRRVRVAGNDTQHEKRTHHCKNFSVVKISQKSSDSGGRRGEEKVVS